MRILFLVGLPGAGKSYLAKQFCEKPNTILFDDLGVACSIADFKQALMTEKNLVVTDVNLCEASTREKATKLIKSISPNREIEWIYFENNLEKCRKNVEYRNDGRNVEGTLRRFSKTYTIPEEIKPLTIWTKD